MNPFTWLINLNKGNVHELSCASQIVQNLRLIKDDVDHLAGRLLAAHIIYNPIKFIVTNVFLF